MKIGGGASKPRRSTEALSILDCRWVEGEEAIIREAQEHRSTEGMREEASGEEAQMEIGGSQENACEMKLGLVCFQQEIQRTSHKLKSTRNKNNQFYRKRTPK